MWGEDFLRDAQRGVEQVRDRLRAGPCRAHLVGIGGVGMAGLAILLKSRQFEVSGCDASLSGLVPWLERNGIPVVCGHDVRHVMAPVEWMIRTAAVSVNEEEVAAAMRRPIPVSVRGTVLPVLLDGRMSVAVSGTHGKTTTTAMIAQILRAAGRDPGFAIGGEVPALGGVASNGSGSLLVVEADESDGTVALYESDYAVVTNAELDHVDFFPTPSDLEACLGRFAAQARRAAVLNADDPGAARIAGRIPRRITFGRHPEADLRLTDDGLRWRGRGLGRIELSVFGEHNLQNALAASATALDLGVPFETVRAALRNFQPARRRFDVIAQERGVTVISDYAHHPTEIRALLAQARLLGAGRIRAVFQPHRFTRTAALAADFPPAFAGVDELVIAPVYAASEEPVPGGTSADLARRFGRDAVLADSLEAAWEILRADLRPGDLLLVIGAGDVEKIAQWASAELKAGAEDGTSET